MWQSLALNLCVISSAVVAWQLCADRLDRGPKWQGRFIFGLFLGLAGCLSMTFADPFIPGFVFDLRSPMVACAAFFGGPGGALPALVLTGGLRIHIGGSGALAGLVSLACAAGLALGYRVQLGTREPSPDRLALLAALVTAGVCIGYILVPRESFLQVVTATFLPMVSLTFTATWIVAMLCHREFRRRDLLRSKRIYRQMVELLPDSLNAKDTGGRFIAANPACARLQGLDDPRDLIGLTDADFFEGERLAQFRQVERSVIETGAPLTAEQEVRVAGKEAVIVQTQKVPILDESGTVIGLITHNRDVTQERRLSRMKSEFVSIVSHELRTPLTSVRGSLGLLSASLDESAPASTRKLLDIADRNSTRLVRLINDILDVEKIENGNLDFDIRITEVAPLIREALPSYANYMPEQKVEVRILDEAPGARAMIDVARFEQVLSNLVSNAIKFSEPGGTVTVSLLRRDGRLVVSVADTGRGIPEHFRDRVFARFEQVDASDSRQKGGTGLGLHIAKVIVERMGGQVTFVSEVGRGTTFFVTLPEHAADAGAADPVGTAGDIRTTGSDGDTFDRRILYVEDDSSLAQIVAEMLRPDIRVDHAATLEAGRAALRKAKYDMLLVDDALPDGSGLRLVDEAGADLPSILLTAREIEGPLPAQVRGRFVKTRVQEREVAERIRAILDRPAAPLGKPA